MDKIDEAMQVVDNIRRQAQENARNTLLLGLSILGLFVICMLIMLYWN